MKISALTGDWWAECAVCGTRYHMHVGSTACCGSIAYVVDNVTDPEEQAEADRKLMEGLVNNQPPALES